MAKDKQTKPAKGGAGRDKLAQRQKEIATGLNKLSDRFAKLHDRQKRLRSQGRDRKHENLAFARDLRKLQRKTNGLLEQLSALKADGRRMEQRMAADLLNAGEVNTLLASYDDRLAGSDQLLEELQGRNRELERLGQETSGRADALEHHIGVMQEELRSYAQAVSSAQLTLPAESEQAQDAETVEVVNGSADSNGRPSGNGQGSNVLVFRTAEQGAAGIDDRLLEDLDKRISGLERLTAGLDERIQGFGLAMHNLENGQREFRGEQESIRQWLEQQSEELFAGQDALRAYTARLDTDLRELGQARNADREILIRLDHDGGTSVECIDRLERQLAAADSRAQELAGQVEGLESAADALKGDAEQRLEESHVLRDQAANLGRGLEQMRAAGSAVQLRLGELNAADARLAEGHRELADRAGALSAEAGILDERQGRFRLGLGLLGLLLLGLAVAGYSLFESWMERQAQTFAQDLTELQRGLEAGEDRLDAQVAELERLSQSIPGSAGDRDRIEKMGGLIRAQDKLLIAQHQDLGLVQGRVDALRAEQVRLLARAERMEEALEALESRQDALKSGIIAAATPAADGVLLGPDWLAAQEPAHYTIQIIAAHDPQAIADTSQAHAYSADLAQYRRLRNGRDWYVLVHGSYPSLKAAVAALDWLPAGVQPYGPWVRRFGSVQRQLTRP